MNITDWPPNNVYTVFKTSVVGFASFYQLFKIDILYQTLTINQTINQLFYSGHRTIVAQHGLKKRQTEKVATKCNSCIGEIPSKLHKCEVIQKQLVSYTSTAVPLRTLHICMKECLMKYQIKVIPKLFIITKIFFMHLLQYLNFKKYYCHNVTTMKYHIRVGI